MIEVEKEYKELLKKYCNNKELTKLINFCIIDIQNARDTFYEENGYYPDQRDGIMKLKSDLQFARKIKELEKGENNGR